MIIWRMLTNYGCFITILKNQHQDKHAIFGGFSCFKEQWLDMAKKKIGLGMSIKTKRNGKFLRLMIAFIH